jgi:Cu-processing system ATP-binding protein
MSSNITIELKAVDKHYDKTQVLESINLQVHSGESFVLVGHNGAGKTSIIKLMLGLTQASAGRVTVMGDDPSNRSFSDKRRSIGYLPESVSFYHHMTGRELLDYYTRLKGIAKTEAGQRLEQVGLLDAANKRLNTYSKGMRQRLGLAQAILGSPSLLFLDEPTTGLDPTLRRDFYHIIGELRDQGTTVVISSHSLNEVESQADRVALIKQGKLVACGTLDSLSRQVGLPVKTTLRLADDQLRPVTERLQEHFQVTQLGNQEIELVCTVEEKVSALKHIAELGDRVLDISMAAPRLDEIYLHFMHGESS